MPLLTSWACRASSCRRRLGAAALLVLATSAAIAAEVEPSSGLDYVDAMRAQVKTSPTTNANLDERLNAMEVWARALGGRGADMTRFSDAVRTLYDSRQRAITTEAVDRGMPILEAIQRDFASAPRDFRTEADAPAVGAPLSGADWPAYHGNAQQTGWSPDPGPSQGRLAWQFPVGRAWYARPCIERGRVYVTSPGMATIAYCLDERTGKVLWRSSQRGNGHQYGTPQAASSVYADEKNIYIREVGSGGERGSAKHVVMIDKANGAVRGRMHAGHVDYRVGYAPFAVSDGLVVFLRATQEIGHAQQRNLAISGFDRLVAANLGGEELWVENIGSSYSEPVVAQGVAYIGNAAGEMRAVRLRGDDDRVAWTFHADGPIDSAAEIADGAVLFGTQAGTVYCLDSRTGTERWQTKLNDREPGAFQLFSTTCTHNHRVYIGSAAKRLHCLDFHTGKPRWTAETSDWIRARPAVCGDGIAVAGLDGNVVCYRDAGDHADTVWSARPTIFPILADLVTAGDGLYVTSSDLYISKLRAADGKSLWRQSAIEAVYEDGLRIPADYTGGGGDYQSSPVVAEGLVLVGASSRFVHAVAARTGREVWRYETRGAISAAPRVADGRVFFGDQGGTGEFFCLDLKTGKQLWSKNIGWVWSTCNVVGHRVLIPTVTGDCVCLDARDGRELWRYASGSGSYPAPAVAEGRAFFGAWQSKFFALDIASGKRLWQVDVHGEPDSGATVVADGRVFLQALGAKSFFCVDAATGDDVWEWPLPAGWECNVTPSAHDGKVYFSIFWIGAVSRFHVPTKTICLEAATGKPIWEYPGGGGLTGSVLAGGKLFTAGSCDPFIWCMDATGSGEGTTRILWRFRTEGRMLEGCPAICGDTIYTLSTGGWLYAIR